MGEEVSEVDDFDEIELLLDKIPNFFQLNNQKAIETEPKMAFMDSWLSSLASEPPEISPDVKQFQWLPQTNNEEDEASSLTRLFSDSRITNSDTGMQMYTSIDSSQNLCSCSSDMDHRYTDTWHTVGFQGRIERGFNNDCLLAFERLNLSNSSMNSVEMMRIGMSSNEGWLWPHYIDCCSFYGFRNPPYSAITDRISMNRVPKQSTLDHVTSLLRRLRTENGYLDIYKLNSLDSSDMCLLAKDQHGCRLLQGMFAEGRNKDTKKLFLKIIDHILELVMDPYGNYLIQKLIDISMEWQITQILFMVSRCPTDLIAISCNIHGTRVIQKLIEALTTSDQFVMMASSLKPCMVTLFKDQNGSHVATCFLQFMHPQYTGFLFEMAARNCVEVATNQHGCCVIQKLLNHYKEDQSHSLFHQISSNALLLSQHQYGNYAVQYVLFLRIAWATIDVIKRLYGNYGSLSTQKYSSNVVEKCLFYGDEAFQLEIVHELLDYPRFSDILQDQYGNYVIQSALKFSKGRAHSVMVKAIRPYAHTLKAFPFGKKILSSCGIKR